VDISPIYSIAPTPYHPGLDWPSLEFLALSIKFNEVKEQNNLGNPFQSSMALSTNVDLHII
jgi:hypothetical protein